MFDRLRRSGLQTLNDELVDLVEQVSESVVTVRTTTSTLTSGSGSGWMFEPGIVITNAHVVAGESPAFKLRIRGGGFVAAELVGADEATDIAVLRAPTVAPKLELRHQSARLGELCFAFGNPLGEFPESVTFGVISGLQRRLDHKDGSSIEGMLQTDAEINPGNSGGPLVDLTGVVLGMNTAIRADGRGIGFAVPARTIASIVPEILAHGTITRPSLGITIEVTEGSTTGAEVERLRVASVAREHTLRPGDVLIKVAGRDIVTRADLFGVLRRPLIGTTIEITVERDGLIVALPFSFDR